MLLPAKTVGDDNSRTFEYAGDVRKNRGDCVRSLSGASKAFRKMRLFARGMLALDALTHPRRRNTQASPWSTSRPRVDRRHRPQAFLRSRILPLIP